MQKKFFEKALYIAKKFCSKSEKCSSDVLKKLNYYNISNNQKLRIIEELKKEKFIDEERYTKAYVHDKFKFNKWGKIKIFYALKNKNISEALIYKHLENIDMDDYIKTLAEIIGQKKSVSKVDDPHKLKASIIRFASGRGFEYDLITKLIEDDQS